MRDSVRRHGRLTDDQLPQAPYSLIPRTAEQYRVYRDRQIFVRCHTQLIPKCFSSWDLVEEVDGFVQVDSLRIAVEVKRGETGASVREGLGQSLVYSCEFDFVCYIFVDVSKDKKVKRSLDREAERHLVEDLWENHNVRFGVV